MDTIGNEDFGLLHFIIIKKIHTKENMKVSTNVGRQLKI